MVGFCQLSRIRGVSAEFARQKRLSVINGDHLSVEVIGNSQAVDAEGRARGIVNLDEVTVIYVWIKEDFR